MRICRFILNQFLAILICLTSKAYYVDSGFNQEPQRNFCDHVDISLMSSSKIKRSEDLDKVLDEIKTQSSFCPGSYDVVVFARNGNEKLKDKLKASVVTEGLLHLETISAVGWSESIFLKNKKDIEHSLSEIEDISIKNKLKKWLDRISLEEKKYRETNNADLKTQCGYTSVDLSRMPKNSLQHNSIDSGVGWCYAYSAAQLLGYEIGEAVSAPDIAITYNRMFMQKEKMNPIFSQFGNQSTPELIKIYKNEINKDPIYKNIQISDSQTEALLKSPLPDLRVEGGDGHYAILTALKHGICLDRDFKSDFASDGRKPIFDILQKLQSVRMLGNVLCDKELDHRIAQRFPGLDLNQISDIFTNDKKQQDIVDILRDKSCKRIKPNIKTKNTICDSKYYGVPDAKCNTRLYEHLMSSLSSGKPVLIGINVTQVTLPESFHAVVIYQRKYDPVTKECMFKVRDSNQKNDYWVSGGQLLGRTFSTTSVEKK